MKESEGRETDVREEGEVGNENIQVIEEVTEEGRQKDECDINVKLWRETTNRN